MGRALRDEFPSNTELAGNINALQPEDTGGETIRSLTRRLETLNGELNGKADAVHEHTASQITGLPSLDNYALKGSYTTTVVDNHSHDVTI